MAGLGAAIAYGVANQIQSVRSESGDGQDDGGDESDPETGEVLSCRGGGQRAATICYRGRTAKELGIALTEGEGPHPVSRLDHALYLGRELQKAEACLLQGKPYVQD